MSQNSETSWIDSDPLDKNLARMVRDNLIKIDSLATDLTVRMNSGALEGNEFTRLVRTVVSTREKAIRLAVAAMDKKVGNAIAERKKTVEA